MEYGTQYFEIERDITVPFWTDTTTTPITAVAGQKIVSKGRTSFVGTTPSSMETLEAMRAPSGLLQDCQSL